MIQGDFELESPGLSQLYKLLIVWINLSNPQFFSLVPSNIKYLFNTLNVVITILIPKIQWQTFEKDDPHPNKIPILLYKK